MGKEVHSPGKETNSLSVQVISHQSDRPQFGGDPNHVVIHGASAGAGSVAYHLAAYGGRNDGLFVGAVAESPFWPAQRNSSESEAQFSQFIEAVGCSTISCLRSANITAIQKAQATSIDLTDPTRTTPSSWEFGPVVDGAFIQDRLYPLFAQENSSVFL